MYFLFFDAGLGRVLATANKRGASKNSQWPARLTIKVFKESKNRKKYAKVESSILMMSRYPKNHD